jgi:hypothetical protein
VGASIGVAALAYRRKPRSRWDRAVDRAGDLIETVRKESKPWMGATAGTAAAGTALALYMRKPKETGWQQVRKRAGDIASSARTQATGPWANLAATAAISLASVAYANRARRRTIRGIDAGAADRINSIMEKGRRILDGVRNIREQTRTTHGRGRRALA